jgi:hypothetical protein
MPKHKEIVIVSNPSDRSWEPTEHWLGYFDRYAPEVFKQYPCWTIRGSCWEVCQPLDAYTSDMDLKTHVYLDDDRLKRTWMALTGTTEYPSIPL